MSTDGPASEPPTAELRDPIEKLDAQRRTRRQNILVTLAWMLHWVLRMGLAAMLLVYGWSKVVLLQMGLPDHRTR